MPSSENWLHPRALLVPSAFIKNEPLPLTWPVRGTSTRPNAPRGSCDRSGSAAALLPLLLLPTSSPDARVPRRSRGWGHGADRWNLGRASRVAGDVSRATFFG